MSKRKNTQSKNSQKQMPTKPVTQAAMELSNEVKADIETLNKETEAKQHEECVDSQPLTSVEESKALESEKSGDLKKYLKYLTDINCRLNGLIKNVEEKKSEAEKIKQDAIAEKESWENENKKLKQKSEDLNSREKDVLERELQLDNGEFTGTIRSLLDAFRKSGQQISTGARELLDSLGTEHSAVLSKEKEISDRQFEIEVEKEKIDRERNQILRDKRKMQTDMEIFKEDLKEQFEIEYGEKYNDERAKSERLEARNEILEGKEEELKQLKLSLSTIFGGREPQDILNEVERIREESQMLHESLNSRPTHEEMSGLRKQIDELKNENIRLNGMVSEKELNELKKVLNNSDSYIIEIQGYKDKLESSKNREDSLRRVIEDLKSTIDQLKGEHQKDEEAFQFARKYDTDFSLQDKGFRDQSPSTLFDFANFMQRKIASSDKPFFYDIDTIRVFIAGLNMSNISILQGISGTGKTSLPREFSKAIISNAPEYSGQGKDQAPNAPYRICAVQSGWRDNMDLMGYYNSFEHKYKETEFFKALYLAGLPKYSDTLFFIILDEMNLSRPEHYFADFLSLLEQKEDERFISVNAPDEVLPKEIKGGKMRVPENVRFIGTANHDETTLEFAPKTYDRSNLMEMPKNQNHNISHTDDSYNVSYTWLKNKFKEAISTNNSYYKRFKSFINSDDIKNLLMEKGIGVGNRFEDQAERFICTFIETGDPNKKDESLAKATDHLITTRLFRTLRNRYDLDKHNLQTFKEKFDSLFSQTFINCKPTIADDLLNAEIEKK